MSRNDLVASVRAIAQAHESVGHLYIDETARDVVRLVIFVKADNRPDAVAQCTSLVDDLQGRGELGVAAVITD